MRIYLTGIPERAVLVKFSQIRGKLIGSRVSPDKLDLHLITRRDILASSNSCLLTARGRLWLSHMGHMKVRARSTAETPTVHLASARWMPHRRQVLRKRSKRRVMEAIN